MEKNVKEKSIEHYHQHVDNGGLTIELVEVTDNDKYGGKWHYLKIESSYIFVQTVINFFRPTAKDLREFGRIFLHMADYLDKQKPT